MVQQREGEKEGEGLPKSKFPSAYSAPHSPDLQRKEPLFSFLLSCLKLLQKTVKLEKRVGKQQLSETKQHKKRPSELEPNGAAGKRVNGTGWESGSE